MLFITFYKFVLAVANLLTYSPVANKLIAIIIHIISYCNTNCNTLCVTIFSKEKIKGYK